MMEELILHNKGELSIDLLYNYWLRYKTIPALKCVTDFFTDSIAIEFIRYGKTKDDIPDVVIDYDPEVYIVDDVKIERIHVLEKFAVILHIACRIKNQYPDIEYIDMRNIKLTDFEEHMLEIDELSDEERQLFNIDDDVLFPYIDRYVPVSDELIVKYFRYECLRKCNDEIEEIDDSNDMIPRQIKEIESRYRFLL